MSHFEELSGEILMAILEYMDVEDVWTIFFKMNSRFNSLVYDSRLRLTADVSKIEKYNFDQFCSSLIQTNFNNIFTLILSNNYYRYPQIRQFLSHTNLTCFQSLYSLTLIDINHEELMNVGKQIRQLRNLHHLHINTHEIYRDQHLAEVTMTVLDQPNVRVLAIEFHEKIQWLDTEIIPLSNVKVLSLNFINIDRLFSLLPQCPHLHSLSMSLDSRSTLALDDISPSFPHLTHLRCYFRPFNASVLERLLTSFPSIKRFSIDTLISKADYIRAPFWTLLLQQRLPFLERIRLVVRGYYLFQYNDHLEGNPEHLIDGYRYDRYWLDRAYKKIFTCHANNSSLVLQIR